MTLIQVNVRVSAAVMAAVGPPVIEGVSVLGKNLFMIHFLADIADETCWWRQLFRRTMGPGAAGIVLLTVVAILPPTFTCYID
ncbi:hypothetical protein K435DRAFT_403302 [Dendrothele bispora CBS 962.96]|uniref:Uncharacterized protein n=1 Tax=Dendrothele bispora (strain CBS 962.96) TaxID=1314807 RepID=A0A4S8L7V1_DENBC|nr:hypothetical protein K435DRAFT_403302 [Dendrothele bispora CBS 962.96]